VSQCTVNHSAGRNVFLERKLMFQQVLDVVNTLRLSEEASVGQIRMDSTTQIFLSISILPLN